MNGDAPKLGQQSFVCPHCRAKAHQFWYFGRATHAVDNQLKLELTAEGFARRMAELTTPQERDKFNQWSERFWYNRITLEREVVKASVWPITRLYISKCYSCSEIALWCGTNLIYPASTLEHVPHPDLPIDIKPDFDEAAKIAQVSPRGAAALLRLCIQKLMPHLGEPGKNINDDIASLVKKGLPVQVQQALDVVRVVGNNAVHPGTIAFDDSGSVATSLFNCVNLIVETMITQRKQLEGLFAGLPKGAREAIKRRDGDPN